jgi:hypothetical protein
MLSDAANPDAPALIKPTVVSVRDESLVSKTGGITLEDYAVVVVNDVPQLPSALQNRLADYVRSGHGVWFILGRNTEKSFISEGLQQSGLFHAKPNDRQDAAEKPPALDVKDPQNVMVADFTAPEHNILTGMSTMKWWSLRPESPDAQVVLSTDTGDPLVIERKIGSNGGRVVLWTTPVDKHAAWNNWPAMPAFVPLVNVTVYHLAGGWTKGIRNGRLNTGETIEWTGPGSPTLTRAEVTQPDGTMTQQRPVYRDGRQIVTHKLTQLPGKYELRFPDRTEFPQPVYYGVGIDPAELDATALSEADRAWLKHEDHKFVEETIDAGGIASALGHANKGTELWPWLAGFVVLTLLGETFMTYRMMRRQQATDVNLGAIATSRA